MGMAETETIQVDGNTNKLKRNERFLRECKCVKHKEWTNDQTNKKNPIQNILRKKVKATVITYMKYHRYLPQRAVKVCKGCCDHIELIISLRRVEPLSKLSSQEKESHATEKSIKKVMQQMISL